jgi:thiamine transport system substrate-binding protein
VKAALVVAFALAAAACSTSSGTPANEVVLMTHDSFAVSPDVLDTFEAETGVAVRLLPAGDAGAMLSQAILTKDNPLADVIYGIDNTFLGRALEEKILRKYEPEALSLVSPDLVEGTEGRATPIDFGDVCLNYDRAAFADSTLPVPETLEALADPVYRSLLAVEDPSTSSPGLAFLLATIDRFGDPGWQDYWQSLRDNDVLVASGWEEAYYGEFSGGTGAGDRPLVVSYASSPVAEIVFSAEPIAEAPTAAILDGCFRQVEYAGVLTGAAAPEEAERLIDFMLAEKFQQDIPLNMFVFPAVTGTPLPVAFLEYADIAEDPTSLDPATIDENRQRWIVEWADVVLR